MVECVIGNYEWAVLYRKNLTSFSASQEGMSTIVEPVVAHDEKSKFFIFFPEIAYGKPRNVV